VNHKLYNHINKFITIDESIYENIASFFEIDSVKKKTTLTESGTTNFSTYFVIDGLLQMYFIREDGVKQTIQFAIEDWWICDFLAFHKTSKTDFYIEAVEPSKIMSISKSNYELLLKKYPIMESYFRKVYQIAYGASLVKFKYLFNYSKEDIYFHFTESFPEFEQRVPQYLIASFLGLTPEYVSKIRRQKRS
jgi:CRP-like cAMP-binding protein